MSRGRPPCRKQSNTITTRILIPTHVSCAEYFVENAVLSSKTSARSNEAHVSNTRTNTFAFLRGGVGGTSVASRSLTKSQTLCVH